MEKIGLQHQIWTQKRGQFSDLSFVPFPIEGWFWGPLIGLRNRLRNSAFFRPFCPIIWGSIWSAWPQLQRFSVCQTGFTTKGSTCWKFPCVITIICNQHSYYDCRHTHTHSISLYTTRNPSHLQHWNDPKQFSHLNWANCPIIPRPELTQLKEFGGHFPYFSPPCNGWHFTGHEAWWLDERFDRQLWSVKSRVSIKLWLCCYLPENLSNIYPLKKSEPFQKKTWDKIVFQVYHFFNEQREFFQVKNLL